MLGYRQLVHGVIITQTWQFSETCQSVTVMTSLWCTAAPGAPRLQVAVQLALDQDQGNHRQQDNPDATAIPT